MKVRSSNLDRWSRGVAAAFGFAAVALVCGAAPLRAEVEPQQTAPPRQDDQKVFGSPQAAVDALVAALEANEEPALLAVLGSDAPVGSGDPVADANAREKFVALYKEKHELVPSDDSSTVLQIGAEAWPFPIPIVRGEQGWTFDTEAGEDEILNRRIGNNERSAIQASLAYTDAQREYYVRGVAGEPLRYAQKFASTPGERDGLYWPTEGDEIPSPLGELFAAAREEGYAVEGGGEPFHGYYFKILTGQGPNAAGGAYDYVVRDMMIGGFALVAFPAEYGVSGVMTFLVNHDGVVYEKDLGPDTAELAGAIKVFDPGEGWKPVQADELELD